MALSQQVQLLQPLQPKLSTTEVERDTALHKLERLQVRTAYGSSSRQSYLLWCRSSQLRAKPAEGSI